MARPENGKDGKALQRVALIAAAAIASAGILFTIGYFVGRGTGGTEVKVYVQNPEGVYAPAQTDSQTKPTEAPLLRSQPEEPAQTSTAGQAAATTAVGTMAALRLIEEEKPHADTSARTQTVPEETSTSGTSAETETTTAASETTTARQTSTAAKVTTLGIININTATQSQLETLPGIGPVKASAIIAYRQEHGTFKSVEDLVKVSGIGKKTLDSIRDHITVG